MHVGLDVGEILKRREGEQEGLDALSQWLHQARHTGAKNIIPAIYHIDHYS